LPEHDHSSWSIGPAELGFGDGDEQTVIDFGGDPQNVHVTTYFRYKFNIVVAERFQSLTAWLLRDDGAVVYLNGVEVFRDNGLPEDATYATFVNQRAGENATTTFSANTSSLVDGANVIAVEVHQATSSSSDLSFDFSLNGELETSHPATVTISVDSTSITPGDVNLDGTVDATDIDDLYDAIEMESRELRFDVDGDGLVALTDMDYLLSSIFNTTQGDTDLDGDVDTGDLTRAIIGFTGAGGAGKGWADGDTDGDGDIDTKDLTRAIIRFTGARSASRAG